MCVDTCRQWRINFFSCSFRVWKLVNGLRHISHPRVSQDPSLQTFPSTNATIPNRKAWHFSVLELSELCSSILRLSKWTKHELYNQLGFDSEEILSFLLPSEWSLRLWFNRGTLNLQIRFYHSHHVDPWHSCTLSYWFLEVSVGEAACWSQLLSVTFYVTWIWNSLKSIFPIRNIFMILFFLVNDYVHET